MSSLRRWWWLSLALVAALWFFVARPQSSADEPQGSGDSLQDSLGSEGPLEAAPVDPEVVPSSEIPGEVVPPEVTESTRTSVPKRKREARDPEVTIRGRVVIPPGTPSDERVTVLAREAPFTKGTLHRAVADSDGRFEVSISRLAGRAQLGVEARYLYLDRGTLVRVASIPDEVLLEPQLGGRIYGTIRLSAAAQRKSGSARIATLRARGRDFVNRRGRIAEDLKFEINALPPSEYELEFSPVGGLVGRLLREIEVLAGGAKEVLLETELGASIDGRVIDEEGVPFVGVKVRAYSSSSASVTRPGTTLAHEMTSDEEGRFRLDGISLGMVSVDVTGPFVETTHRVVELLVEGGVQDNFEIVAKRLGAISGRVLWPDGRPAADCLVRTVGNDPSGDCRTDEDGRFLLREFGRGPVDLLARVELNDKSAWFVTARGVAAGTSDLEMVLRPCQVVTVRVIDEDRRPVTSAEVEVTAIERSPNGNTKWSSWLRSEPDGEKGALTLQLHDGEWDVEAKAPGLATSGKTFRVPGADSELELVLLPEATIEGRVVDSTGQPVPFAIVRLEIPAESSSVLGSSRWVETASREGAFHFRGVESGRFQIRAAAPNRVFSEATPIEVRRSEHLTGIVVTTPPERGAAPRR